MKEEQILESTLAYVKNIQESPKDEVRKSLSGERDYPLISVKDLKDCYGTIYDTLCKINAKIHEAYWEGKESVSCLIPTTQVFAVKEALEEKGYVVKHYPGRFHTFTIEWY